jgi:hypothetical protein
MDVSVLTAARLDSENKVRWLNEAMESIESQRFDGTVEWVVVDDDSPMPPELPPHGWIVRAKASRRQGPAMCRNTAQRLASGRARIVLDADDMLAGPDVLAKLFDAWKTDETRFVYGDIQLYENGQPGKVVPLTPDGYSFEATLNPKGVVPVTAMHSESCWRNAGGWKRELDAGLEDLEFWIAAGAAGHCGLKMEGLTAILYRKHLTSRTQEMRAEFRQQEMQDRIREMHADLYEGRWPVGCCGGKRGGGGAGKPLAIPNAPRSLAGDHVAGGKVWVRYNGKKSGGFGIKGQITGEVYRVDTVGAEFQIWSVDADFFRRQGRGRDFSVGIPEPVQPEAERPAMPEPETVPEERFVGAEPELAEIVQMPPQVAEALRTAPQRGRIDLSDGVQPEELALAGKTIERSIKDQFGAKYARVAAVEVDEPADARELLEAARDHPLEDMDLSPRMQAMLEDEGWTVPKLARAAEGELEPYPGIGAVTERRILDKAKALWAS